MAYKQQLFVPPCRLTLAFPANTPSSWNKV